MDGIFDIIGKEGLLFDEQDDAIFEVYDSWYELFKQMRELIKEIPNNRYFL